VTPAVRRFSRITVLIPPNFYVHKFALDRLGIDILINRPGIPFNCARALVKRTLKKGLVPPKQRGRHRAGPDDSEVDILAWIQDQAEKSQPSTKTDILHYCSGKFGKAVTRCWVDSFLIPYKGDLTETISKPQEDARLQVRREFFLRTISGMEDAMQGCIRDLVFNLHEIGVSEWEDCKSKKVVVPSAMSSHVIHHGVNRNRKHITVITCVAANGEHVIPCIVMSQESHNLQKVLRKKGVEFGWHLALKTNQKLYISSKSFAECIK
jgi:hypothetical protein